MASLELLHQAIEVLSIVAALISSAFLIYCVWATRKLNPETVFAVGIARAVVIRVYRVVVLLALLSTMFLFGSYLVKYFFQDRLLESVMQLIFLVLFLWLSIFSLAKQYLTKARGKQANNKIYHGL